jgi:hypothetical protein
MSRSEEEGTGTVLWIEAIDCEDVVVSAGGVSCLISVEEEIGVPGDNLCLQS